MPPAPCAPLPRPQGTAAAPLFHLLPSSSLPPLLLLFPFPSPLLLLSLFSLLPHSIPDPPVFARGYRGVRNGMRDFPREKCSVGAPWPVGLWAVLRTGCARVLSGCSALRARLGTVHFVTDASATAAAPVSRPVCELPGCSAQAVICLGCVHQLAWPGAWRPWHGVPRVGSPETCVLCQCPEYPPCLCNRHALALLARLVE